MNNQNSQGAAEENLVQKSTQTPIAEHVTGWRCLDAGLPWWLGGGLRSGRRGATTLLLQLDVQPHTGLSSQLEDHQQYT